MAPWQLYVRRSVKFVTIWLAVSQPFWVVEAKPPVDTKWYISAAGMLGNVIESVAVRSGGADKEKIKVTQASDAGDTWTFPDVMENAKAQLSDIITGLMQNEEGFSAGLEATKRTLWENLPNLSQLSPGSSSEEGSEWTWENFLQFMQSKMVSGESSSVDPPNEENFGSDLPPECGMSTPEMIRHAGYICEVHKVETNDGYILDLHRIPFRRDFSAKKQRQPHSRKRPIIFFQHGILSDSSCWVANGPGRSLPFLLADAGYDVWLGNVRGSTYARDHRSLNPDVDERYWRFSWQEMAQSDLPAMIDRALRESGQKSLYYIGHSQGTLVAFARLSEDPHFNNKIKMMFALGPVSTLADITSPVRSLVPLSKPAHIGLSLFGGLEVMPKKPISKWISAKLHELHNSSGASLIYHGNNLMMFLTGINTHHYFQDRLPIYFSHSPAGTSLQNLVHMSQLVDSGRMEKFNYWSEKENMEAYGQPTPPEYDVSRIRAPVALFIGSDDQLADPMDCKRLSSKLKSMVHFQILQDWDHLDFLWGTKAVGTIYKDIMDMINDFESKLHFNRSANDEL
ncbi:unnamed protein product [Clavelina lepadiformis]|uniref:Partial AB-hydrolase lipase domain-containing protein n=1 Tax=Clavelina lepadiformis TaxID=159417 RepID=A0ABP0GGV3_CLALP